MIGRTIDITLRYGKEVTGITKTSDITDLYTAIQPTGKDGLTIASIVRENMTVTATGVFPHGLWRWRDPGKAGQGPVLQSVQKEDGYILRIWSYETDNEKCCMARLWRS